MNIENLAPEEAATLGAGLNKMKDNQETEDQKQGQDFVVDDDHKANWVLKKIRKLKAKKEEKEKFAEEEIQEIKQWLDEQTEQIDNQIDYFEGLLTEYAAELKEQDEDLKTHKLPAGKLQFRKQRPKWKYHEEMLVSQLRKTGRDELVRIKESVDKRKLKKQVEVVDGQVIDPETGEIIKGVEVQERGEKFKIKVND